MPSKRDEALVLAEELLTNIELGQLPAVDVARKASRLARLLDDTEAMAWLRYEIAGYPNSLTTAAWGAAIRSNRQSAPNPQGQPTVLPTALGQLETAVQGALAQIGAAADAPVSITSANPHQTVVAPQGNTTERSAVRNLAGQQKALLDKVLGAIHEYVADRYQELRFGSAVESAFDVVRAQVDASIAALVPDAPAMLAAAFENAASDNPEHWAGAAATCRRLLKAAADALRPPGEPVSGRIMTDPAYINRLMDWIAAKAESKTAADLIAADLDYLGRRLDAVDDAGQKGAHATVTRFDAARFLTGTYLLLGDILGLADNPNSVGEVAAITDE